MDVLTELKKYRLLRIERRQIEEQIHLLLYQLERPKLSIYTFNRNDIVAVAKYQNGLVTAAEKYSKTLENITKQMKKTENIIACLENPLERAVIRARYIQDKSWNDISTQIGYEWAQVHRIQKNALIKLNNIMNKKKVH